MLNEKEIKRVFNQAMDIWIKPEIERRKIKGQIKDGTEIKRAQIIFTPGEPNKIKLNEEIVIVAEAKAKRDIVKGEEIRESDIEKIDRFIVDYPPNSGHITLFRFLDKWIIIFDARYNRGKIRRNLEISKTFHESAKDDLKNGREIPFLTNCWNSAELSGVCHILCIGGKNKTHGMNVKNFVEWSELGNVDRKHAEVLSRLWDLRSLKYSLSPEPISEDFPEMLKVVREMIDKAEKLLDGSCPEKSYE